MASQCIDSYEKTSVVRGHHIYKSIWTPIIGEELVLKAQDDNEHDKHAFYCDEGRLHRRAGPSFYFTGVMVLPETWWPYPLPCYRKTKAWCRSRSTMCVCLLWFY